MHKAIRVAHGVAWLLAATVGVLGPAGVRYFVKQRSRPQPSASRAPWPLPDHARSRAEAAGLPPYGQTAGATHWHLHLDVFVDGQQVPVPAGIGQVPQYAAVHTHADSGIVHVESKRRNAVVTLRQFFTVWGVRLSSTCVGSYCAPERQVRIYVGGRPVIDPPSLRLTAGQEITVIVGVAPDAIPSGYHCQTAAPFEADSCAATFLQG